MKSYRVLEFQGFRVAVLESFCFNSATPFSGTLELFYLLIK